MRLGLQLGYWGAAPPAGAGELVAAAATSGFDTVAAAESWGSDAFTPLAWWAREAGHTPHPRDQGIQTGSPATEDPSVIMHGSPKPLRLATSVAQLSARTPAACAMHALTLDHLTGGRFALGLGVSGPQVVEGWYGQPFAKPLARTREYVRIVRDVLAREAPVTSPGPHYPLPYDGPDATGLGRPLRPITHPLRADLPIWLGAEGPRNVALAGEIADGWVAVFHGPKLAPLYEEWLAEGMSRPGARRTRDEFEVVANCQVIVTDDRPAALDAMRPVISHYIGGMGAKDVNFHADLFRRMGYGPEVDEITRRFRDGDRAGAASAVPDELLDEISVIGDGAHVRAAVAEREAAGVSMLLVGCWSPEQVVTVAETVRPLSQD